MKSWASIITASMGVLVTGGVASVHGGLKPPPNRWWQVIDNHNGRPGGTPQSAIFQTEDKNYHLEYSDQCRTSYANYGHFFLGGFAFGHADPRLTDPKAFCGHGIATLVDPPEPRTPALLIMPETSPVDPDAAGPVNLGADAVAVIQEQLPRLDKPEGDKVLKVVELRKVVAIADTAKALKNLPRRTAPKAKD